MFSSFQAVEVRDPPRPVPRTNRAVRRVGATAHACTECRRRKSRCDAQQPCTRCRESNKAHLCEYVSQKPRVIPSQRKLDQLTNSLLQCRSILQRVFPGRDETELVSKTRDELVQLAQNPISPSGLSDRTFPSPSSREPNLNDTSVLEQLQPNPSEYDEESPDNVADDVNALNLSDSPHSSYVGSSSISAALRAISSLCPGVMGLSNLPPPKSPSNRSESILSQAASASISYEKQNAFIDAYFKHVHFLVPMVNEQQLRKNFASYTDSDVGHVALLNMVLALGSIAEETARETTHFTFYERARQALSFDSLGAGKIEVIQALGLMGGLYLHYCNRPNMAVAIMGAALRMACALGLHRVSLTYREGNGESNFSYNHDPKIKQQTWWSLVCLDILGSTTLGRPSIGDCFGPAISTLRPILEEMRSSVETVGLIPLAANVDFCELSAQMQQRLASSPRLSFSEIQDYDERLQKNLNQFRAFTQPSHLLPHELLVPRAILTWRYQNARLLLYRPVLLEAAVAHKSVSELNELEKNAINMCRGIAQETINDIACNSQADSICGWNAVWLLFQATMVPLVSLFYEYDNEAGCERWNTQIDLALKVLDSQENWSPVGQRTKQVVAEMQRLARTAPPSELPPDRTVDDIQNENFWDDPWQDDMLTDFFDWAAIPLESFSSSAMQPMQPPMTSLTPAHRFNNYNVGHIRPP